MFACVQLTCLHHLQRLWCLLPFQENSVDSNSRGVFLDFCTLTGCISPSPLSDDTMDADSPQQQQSVYAHGAKSINPSDLESLIGPSSENLLSKWT